MEDIKVTVVGGELSEQEINAYIAHAKNKYSDRKIEALELSVDGEFVDIKYTLAPVSFQRIRRITGYLVGTLDRFNSAKRSEVDDRVKHSMTAQEISCCFED